MSALFNPSAASALFSSCNWCWTFADVVAGAFAAARAAAAFAAVAFGGAGVARAAVAAAASGAGTGAAVFMAAASCAAGGAVKIAAVSVAFTGFACGFGACANRNSAAGENSVIWLTVNSPAASAAFCADGVNWSTVAPVMPLFSFALLGGAA